jgi:hypothetical protein
MVWQRCAAPYTYTLVHAYHLVCSVSLEIRHEVFLYQQSHVLHRLLMIIARLARYGDV